MLDSLNLKDGEQLHFYWCITEGRDICPANVEDKSNDKLCQYALWIPRELSDTSRYPITSLRHEKNSKHHGSDRRRSKRKRC